MSDYNLAQALDYYRAGELAKAESVCRQLLAQDASAAEAWHLLGAVCYETNRADEAVEYLERAVALEPNKVEYQTHLGAAYDAAGRYGDAVATLRRAVALGPQSPQAHANLGMVLLHDLRAALADRARLEEAASHLRQALELRPGSPPLWNNLGTALRGLGRIEEAFDCYEQAIADDDRFAEAYLGRATCRLIVGNLVGGFADYEWRWQTDGYQVRSFSQPRWDGTQLTGRSILLYAEQGLGDTLQFVRFVQAAQRAGGTVLVECQPALMRLLAGTPGINRLIPQGAPLPAFDVQAPLLSLPGILRLTVDTLSEGPYLFAAPALVEDWRQRLKPRKGFRIGVGWQGALTQLVDFQRSLPLQAFASIAQVPSVRLFSLQKGAGTEQISQVDFEVQPLGPDFDEAAGPFMDTAAVMKNLDLVITCDTSLAHLAGGLGVPVWVALPNPADWRWLLERADSPWYPTMRLFRQPRMGDWERVFSDMAAELARHVRPPDA